MKERNILLLLFKQCQWVIEYPHQQFLSHIHFQNITQLNLYHNGFGDEGAKHLAAAFQTMPVSDWISPSTILKSYSLSEYHTTQSLWKLYWPWRSEISCCCFSNNASEWLNILINNSQFISHIHFQSITQLNLYRSGFGDEGAKHLAAALQTMPVSDWISSSTILKSYSLSEYHTTQSFWE